MLSLPRPKWWIPTLLSEASLVRCGSREVSRARTWGLSEARSPLVITAVFTSDLHTLKFESDAFLMRPFPPPPPVQWYKLILVKNNPQIPDSEQKEAIARLLFQPYRLIRIWDVINSGASSSVAVPHQSGTGRRTHLWDHCCHDGVNTA